MFNYVHRRVLLVITSIILVIYAIMVHITYQTETNTIKFRQEEIKKHNSIVTIAIELANKPVEKWLFDNTFWDDMCRFVKNPDVEWAKLNIEESAKNVNVPIVWITDSEFTVVYTWNKWNQIQFNELPVSLKDLRTFLDFKLLLAKNFPHFFYKQDDSFYDLYAMPIQPSSDIERKTKPQGYFFVARKWDDDFLTYFSKLTFSRFQIIEVAQLGKSKEVLNNTPYQIGVWKNLNDFNGNTTCYLFSSYESNSLREHLRIAKLIIFFFIIAVSLFMIVLLLILNRWIVAPLKYITKSLAQHDVKILLPIKKQKTEFGAIAELIHNFFDQQKVLENEVMHRIKVEKELLEIQGNLEDIVEERTKDLLLAKEKAEEANKMKSIFLTNMSHELRTPLFGILGNADLISELGDQKSKYHAMLIQKSGNRLKATLNNLLDLAKLESGKFIFEIDQHDINNTLSNIVEFFKAEAHLKNLQLELDLPKEKVIAKLDLKIFEDAVNNLIQNAIKFTNQGIIKVLLLFNGRDFSVIVKDTGIGITNDHLEIIFEQFRQASEGIGRSYEGSGLGLFLTKKYITLLGGSIDVKSEAEIGTEVSINIPIQNNS